MRVSTRQYTMRAVCIRQIDEHDTTVRLHDNTSSDLTLKLFKIYKYRVHKYWVNNHAESHYHIFDEVFLNNDDSEYSLAPADIDRQDFKKFLVPVRKFQGPTAENLKKQGQN